MPADPKARLLSLRRALQNVGVEEGSADNRAKLQELIQEAQAELDRRGQPSTSDIDWSAYVRTLRDQLATQARIFSDVTVTGRELPGFSGLLPDAADFLAAHHKVFSSFFHSNSAATATFKVDSLGELLNVVLEHPRVAVLGEPGAGKSTTMVALAHALAVRWIDGPAEAEKIHDIPIFAELGGLEHDSLDDYLVRIVSAGGAVVSADAFTSSNVILFLDGLNETTASGLNSVREWLVANSSARVVLSCRTLDYIERELPLRRIEIQPLDPAQVHGLISKFLPRRDADRLFWALAGTEAYNCWRWFQRSDNSASFDEFWFGDVGPTYSYEVEKHKIARYQNAARSGVDLPGMLSLVSNPMLLSAAMLLYLRNSSLPTRRDQLIEEVAISLLERVEFARLVVPSTPESPSSRQVADLVREIVINSSYRMIDEGRGTGVGLDWFRQVVDSVGTGLRADLVVYELERAGILQSYGGARRILRFRHQLIQEYFASALLERHFLQDMSPSELWPEIPQRMPSPWDEVVLLLVNRVDDVDGFTRWIADGNPSLALRAADVGVDRISGWLHSALKRGEVGVAPCPVGLAEWWADKSTTDNRLGVGCRLDGMPDIDWVRVPAGEFVLGDSEVAPELGLAVEPRGLRICYDYAIARYEVTRSQFMAFVQDAYSDDRYWTKLDASWRSGQTEPRLWHDPVYGRGNQPVVGVTWFEAQAFAHWFGLQLAGKQHLVPTFLRGRSIDVSLPLVAEWEYAARYPDGRRYPWGNKYVAASANIDETFEADAVGPYFLQRPSAVGIYEAGKSHLGIYDLAGNVWEWCASRWRPGYEFPEVSEMSTIDHRAVRGGSWYNSAIYAVAACNDCHDADLGVEDVGFRLVIRPSDGEIMTVGES